MTFVLDTLIILISLVFMAILGTVSGVLLPSLFLAAFAPWLDWLLPKKER
jgi:hypothetical protein